MNYNFIQEGAKVRIKTVSQIAEMYGQRMPYGLVDGMLAYCGTIQKVDFVSTSQRDDCKLAVHIHSFMWPEGAFLPTITPKGNTL